VVTARVDEARALAQIVDSQRMPAVDANFLRDRTCSSTVAPIPIPPSAIERDSYRAQLNVFYEVDLWGRLKSASKAAQAELLASEANRETVRIALATEVVRAYFALVAFDAQVEATRRSLALRSDGLALQKIRSNAGLINEFILRQLEAEVAAARAQLPALEARRRKAGVKGPARLSTTDPDARVMKMPDGGYRPAFNAQFMTTTQGQIIVGVAVTNAGTDHGQLHPMVEQVQQRYEQAPTEVLADGGYVDLDDLRALAAARGCQVYAPPPGRADPTRAERPCWRPDDAMVAEWRQRMYSAAGQAVYRERGATSECINAQARNRGLRHLLVRGLRKVRAVLLWFALAHNLLGAVRLRAAAALGP